MPTTAEVRTVAVGGQRLRVAITSGPNGPGREPRIPLLHGPQRNGPSRGYFHQLGAVAGWTGVPFLPRLRQPALILAGDDDPRSSRWPARG
jgi:hypothetical protein